MLVLLVGCMARPTQWPADFEPPLSAQTDAPMRGFGGEGGGLRHTPVLFVHGNTESARFWRPVRAQLLEQGWSEDELWAFSYGWNSVRAFDSNDLAAPSIGRMVDAMTQHLSRKYGREVRQVDIVAHSLGVTAVRQWMKQDNAWHRVRNLVAIAGANHGVWTAGLDARGQNRISSLELAPASPWLEQLNRGGETPGPTRYLALYDGSGWGDVLFPAPNEHSPRLEGAKNLAFNVEHLTRLDHLELARAPQTVDEIAKFLREAHEPLPQATPPRVVREADVLRPDPSEARLSCAADGAYPNRMTTARDRIDLAPGLLQTCYAYDARSGLASPMERFRSGANAATAIELIADPPPGSYPDPQRVSLKANDPDAFIVYTTTGSEPASGSALYEQPVEVVGPLLLRAIAIAPNGTRSTELRLRYDVSLERLEAQHTLQRQIEPDAPIEHRGTRRKGH
jgi:predicted alpha/beta hydrolase family esterase